MSGFLYRGRHCAGEKRARPKSLGPSTDLMCDETDKGPPVQMHSLREFEQHLNDLKKENFSLKLRIYFLEERIQQKYEESGDNVHKRNIELKVEVESLKKDLQERQELLDDAVSTAETLSNQNEEELQHRLAERQEEISHMQELLETKVQLLQEEAQLARGDAEKMASLADSESQRCLALERQMVERMEECGGLLNQHALAEKDRMIEELTQEKSSLGLQVGELEVKVHGLSSSLQKKEREAELLWGDLGREKQHIQTEMQKQIEEQQGQLSQYESAAGQCVGELQKVQDQVHSLQTKIRESESRNQKLQVRLGEMELELRSASEEAQRQERNIQNLSDTINSKEMEAAELYSVIEEQNKMLCSLKELANRNQLHHLQASGAETIRGQGEVLGLQATLFQAQLELQAGQRAQSQATRTQEDLTRALQRLEKDLEAAQQHRRESERHNQELQLALEMARTVLQDRDEQLRDKEGERRILEEDAQKAIRELRSSLQTKDQLVQDYSELLEQQRDPKEKRDSLLQKLRQRIKDRDKALERSVDDKFRCVEEKAEEGRRLQLLLREKERDQERQRCVLNNNEETITSLEVLLRGKGLELEQVGEAWRSAQRLHQESEERQSRCLRERDVLISQVQTALHTRTKEAEDLRGSLLSQLQAGPRDVLEELRARLQLKDRLFQEVLSDRTRQAQEHQAQVQDLLNTIGARDQYIQDSAGRLGEVMSEQTGRLQELRRQLTSGPQLAGPPGSGGSSVELQAMQEDLCLALRREKEAWEESRSQAARLDALARTLHVKEDVIKGFQRQLVEPAALPLVETLTQEIQELRESLLQQGLAPARGPALGRDSLNHRLPEFGDQCSEDEDEDDDDEYADSIDEEESKLTAQSLAVMKSSVTRGKDSLSQEGFEGPGLVDVRQLVEQKKAVERQLGELKAQLEKAGFSSLSQMRKALFSLRAENDGLRHQPTARVHPDATEQCEEQNLFEDEDGADEELDVTIEEDEDEEEEDSEQWDAWDACELRLPKPQLRDSLGKRRGNRPVSLDLGALLSHSTQEDDMEENQLSASRQQSAVATVISEKAVRLQQESKELQERLMVSEATVQAQAEQIKDYRDLLTETSVQQDSKQVQVGLQDLGYETCGRSENEAEREDTSSPEFDDLEMCTSLEGGSEWWPTNASSTYSKTTTPQPGTRVDEVSSLQRLVEELRSQLSRSQAVIRGLQGRLRSFSTASDCGPSTPRKVNWSEDDEGWQSSDGGPMASPRHPHPDKDLQELVTRVGALEDQLRKGGKMPAGEDSKASTWSSKFDTLIQAQAKELSHLRQRMREGRGVCHILTQHLGDTTKAFEELLRANDIDYYMGQSFRDQLAQSSALAQRVSAKISGRDHSEVPDDKTELLAIRLSKELQQKDKVIESLRAKLTQHQSNHQHHLQPQRSDTPCSSHALSETTDQSDRISFVSDEQGSTNEDAELCSDMDAASEFGQEEPQAPSRTSTDCHSYNGTMPHHPSVPPSIASSHRALSSVSCPSMHCTPHKAADTQSQTAGLFSVPMSTALPSSAPGPVFTSTPYNPNPPSTQRAPLPFDPLSATLRPRYQGNGRGGFSLAEVQQELQMLQRQLRDSERFSIPQSGSYQGYPMSVHQQSDPSGFLPLACHGLLPSTLGGTASATGLNAGLNASPAMKAGAGLMENSALWDMSYGVRPLRAGADLSSGSSGYQSGPSHTGSDLMKEHLREIRSLRQRLEDSIQTNDRLRRQLEERLANTAQDKGAPTNIYIQGLDSVGQLSGEIRLLKEENLSLQNQLKQANRDGSKAEHLQEAVLLGRARLKEAELEADRWAEQSRRLQMESQSQSQEITQLKQDRQRNHETINRLQHEVSVLQQQLVESRGLIQSLQSELQMYHRVGGVPKSTHSGDSTVTLNSRELHFQLEQRLTGQGDSHPHSRRKLFGDNVPSPPVRDTGLFSPTCPLSPAHSPAAVPASSLHGQAPDGSFANRHGHHAVGHMDDFKALQQQILEGSALVRKMEASLHALVTPTLREFSLQQPLDTGSVKMMIANTKTLRQILEEASSLLTMFWRAALPSSEESTFNTKQEQYLKEEISSLRQRLSQQEEALRDAMERLKTYSRTNESMEHFIVNQLSRTRDVLKKAKTNLEDNEIRISSLHHASFSLPSPSSSSSRPSCTSKGEDAGGFCELSLSSGWGVMRPLHQAPPSPKAPPVLGPTKGLGAPPHQRPSQVAFL